MTEFLALKKEVPTSIKSIEWRLWLLSVETVHITQARLPERAVAR